MPSSAPKKKDSQSKKKQKKRRVPNIPFTRDAGRQRDSYSLFCSSSVLVVDWVGRSWMESRIRDSRRAPPSEESRPAYAYCAWPWPLFFSAWKCRMDADRHNGQKVPKYYQPNKKIGKMTGMHSHGLGRSVCHYWSDQVIISIKQQQVSNSPKKQGMTNLGVLPFTLSIGLKTVWLSKMHTCMHQSESEEFKHAWLL
jgi:hypothetical protein